MNCDEIKKYIDSSDFEKTAKDLYSVVDESSICDIRDRYIRTLDKTISSFSDGDYHVISSPGRAEICGNHTDHQNGTVVATALDIDNICFAKKTDDNIVCYIDELFEKKIVDLSSFEKKAEEVNRGQSIIRGIAKRLVDFGYKVGGFEAFCHSKVLVGSSMSSSACFEVMIVEIFNCLYNDGKINAVDRAKIAQWAENNYFGKPCGLMDQMAISVGNFVVIDFSDKENPKIEKNDFSFMDYGYDFYIINTKSEHAELTDEYAAIPSEMKMIAKYFGKEVLSEVDEKDFYDNIKNIREKVSNDRAVLRAYHYFNENIRAKNYAKYLKNRNIDKIISTMNESGDSSYMYLQNVYPSSNINTQSISVALAISKKYIGNDSAVRVQGGGFAGTIQAIVKSEASEMYIKEISKVFGNDSVLKVKIRRYGTITII